MSQYSANAGQDADCEHVVHYGDYGYAQHEESCDGARGQYVLVFVGESLPCVSLCGVQLPQDDDCGDYGDCGEQPQDVG